MKERAKNLVILGLSLLVSLPLAEAMFRIAYGVPVFHVEDFRFTKAVRDRFSGASQYDPVLGWATKPGLHLVSGPIRFDTLDYGVRRNGDETSIRAGGVLVVGSSFAAGGEVTDEDAFPAQLEGLMGTPVINASIGGVGVDQIVLRAEQMLPIVKPQILIIDITSGNITIAGYSVAGRPKPYFTINDGKLLIHDVPVPMQVRDPDQSAALKKALGYSLAADRLMASLFPHYWYNDDGKTITLVGNDAVAVSCLLLERIKRTAAQNGTRLLLNVQFGAAEISSWEKPPIDLTIVEECVANLGITVIDEYKILKTLYAEDQARFRGSYVLNPGNILGHKSAAGNLEVAKRLAAILAEGLPPNEPSSLAAEEQVNPMRTDNEVAETGPLTSGDKSLPLSPDRAEAATNYMARVKPTGYWGFGESAYRISAIGGKGEHYVTFSADAPEGPLTLSAEAKADSSSALILQIVKANGSGVWTEFNLVEQTASPRRLGDIRDIRGDVVSLGDGWYRVSTGLNSPSTGKVSIFVELVDGRESSDFQPSNESIMVRHLKLEHGLSPWPSN
jgi:hypothetical protein